MKPAKVILSLVVILAVLGLFVYKRWQEPQAKELFDRHPAHLYFTKHALCRMDCRHISKNNIEEILQQGIIFLNKTNLQARPCATFALQGHTAEGEDIRVIVAQCSNETKVITCYNLKQDFECHCPGDDDLKK